ncbi:MAG: NUDIX hydrolase [Candidatus Buchananbacteria bacterium]
MSVSEKSTFAGRELTLTWIETGVVPQNLKISQVSGYCLDNNNQVLIIKNEHGWGLPGGHPEEGESVEQSLRREILEEADATVGSFKLFGYIEVNDPQNESIEGRDYVQLRFICRLAEISDFSAGFETSERAFVSIADLPNYVTWMAASATGRAQYESFLKVI